MTLITKGCSLVRYVFRTQENTPESVSAFITTGTVKMCRCISKAHNTKPKMAIIDLSLKMEITVFNNQFLQNKEKYATYKELLFV